MTSKKERKKVSPNLNGQNLSEDAVGIRKELQKLNDRLDLNKDNVIELMSAVLSVMNSPDVNYQHNSIIDLGLHGCTLLHVAAALNCDKIADCLIKAGADVNSKDHDMRTPLYYAAMYGKTEVAKLLIERGADVNSQDAHGHTPLQVALDRETAKLLIANGAQINNKEILQALNDRQDLNKDNVIEMMRKCIPHLVKDSSDVNYSRHKIMYYGSFKPILIHCTLLHIAAAFDCDILAKLLIERGADVNLKDARDRTPLQVALEEGHLKTAKLLIDKGADRSCVPAYITKTSKLEGEATAVMMVIITTAVIPLVLIENTELSASVITGATIASMLIVGSIAFGLAYMWKKHELSSILSEVKHDNSISQQQAEKI